MSSNTQKNNNETTEKDIRRNVSDSYNDDFNDRIQSVLKKIDISNNWWDTGSGHNITNKRATESLLDYQKDISNDYGQFRLCGDVSGNYYILNRLIDMGYLVTISKITDDKDGILLVQYRFNRFGI